MGVVSAYRQSFLQSVWVAILLFGSCAAPPQLATHSIPVIPPVLQVVTAVMLHDMGQNHGNLKDFVINDVLESTMPWWDEFDPASLEADFPPEPEWIVPQELWCELPFWVRQSSTFVHGPFWSEAEESARTVFQREHPQAMGLYAFSRPSFSHDGSLATVAWTYYPRDATVLGDVGYARLARIQNEWKVVDWSKESIGDFMRGACVKQL